MTARHSSTAMKSTFTLRQLSPSRSAPSPCAPISWPGAFQLLWLDVTIARLPEFKATKPRRKAAPARKATPRKRKA